MVINQASLFLIFVINGIIIGLVFDIFRILRKSFKTSDIITTIEDILFWIITGIIILYSIFVFNNGEIRFFMFIGIFLGVILYILLLSNYIIKVSVKIIFLAKKIVAFIFKIIIFPVRSTYKIIKNILKKPILFCFINLKKTIRQIGTKISKNKNKKTKKIGENNNKSRIIN
jgi:spore cortex biosynthesis protein YabQ